ncbi:GNAT family N-acetyltransferase [Aquimarina sp. 2201CG14-23]|uniref:GNAT family N-acetyltransferase n=1 Tax=Aquimarina mycalae TaxID=3040073 RepID=UPI002477F17C|nr:GNAT family N-acetyltransferase [Aquimarina sp. 2201CG14-23]MDH7446289.1 GNAT family N-acetyltransferase [Aquimarina sp. 2201CG14-23]
MDVELVKAADVDIEFLFQLRKQTMVEHLENAGLYLSDKDHMSRVKFHFDGSYIVTQSNEKVGVLKYIKTDKTIEILQLQVLPEHQGKGIGKYLLEYMTSLSRSLNKELILKVLKENPARYLYERNGFNVIDEDQYEFHMKQVYNHLDL